MPFAAAFFRFALILFYFTFKDQLKLLYSLSGLVFNKKRQTRTLSVDARKERLVCNR